MERKPEVVLKYLQEVEQTAEKILSTKREQIELDRRRQKTREALRVLHKDSTADKLWIGMGNQFIKFTKKEAKCFLDADYKSASDQISSNDLLLKSNVEKLRDLENKESLKGFNLLPFSKSTEDTDIIGLS